MLASLFSFLLTIRISSGQTPLYSNPGPLDPQTEDHLTDVQMYDTMYIYMDIVIGSFPNGTNSWDYVFFMGDPCARVPDIWLRNPAIVGSMDVLAVHFSAGCSGSLYNTLQGSSYGLETGVKYSFEICYDQTSFVTRMSGGSITGIWTTSNTKKPHALVSEPVYIGWINGNHADADVIITNLVIGRDPPDCNVAINITRMYNISYISVQTFTDNIYIQQLPFHQQLLLHLHQQFPQFHLALIPQTHHRLHHLQHQHFLYTKLKLFQDHIFVVI